MGNNPSKKFQRLSSLFCLCPAPEGTSRLIPGRDIGFIFKKRGVVFGVLLLMNALHGPGGCIGDDEC